MNGPYLDRLDGNGKQWQFYQYFLCYFGDSYKIM